LLEELANLEEDVLNERLMGADHVPIHQPSASRVEECRSPLPLGMWDASQTTPITAKQAEEDEEDVQLKQLQAELAM
jgi:charged multivesicular body protein 4A/B